MPTTRSLYKSSSDLIRAFFERPLPKGLYQLSRYGKVEPPWAPPEPGATPDDYAAAWTVGYDGGPIRGAFRWLGQQGVDDCVGALPKNLQKRGRAPKAMPVENFEELPEVDRVVKSILKHGAAMHDIQELLVGFQEVWAELDKIRPDTWAAEDMIDVLASRNGRGRATEPVPASMVFVWNTSDEPYHHRQLDRAEKLLSHALKVILPGTH